MAEIFSQLNYHYYSIIDQCKQLNQLLQSLGEQEMEVWCGIWLTNTGLYYLNHANEYEKLENVQALTNRILNIQNKQNYSFDPIVQVEALHTFSNELKNAISVKQKQYRTDEINERPIDVI